MERPSLFIQFLKLIFRVIVVIALMITIAVGSFEGVTFYLTGSLYDLKQLTQQAQEITDHTNGSQSDTVTTLSEDMMKDTEVTLFMLQSEDSYDKYMTMNIVNTKTNVLNMLLIPVDAKITVGKDVLKRIQKTIPSEDNPVSIEDIVRNYGADADAMITEIFSDAFGITIQGYEEMPERYFKDFLSMAGGIPYYLKNTMTYRDADGVLQVLEKDSWESADAEDADDYGDDDYDDYDDDDNSSISQETEGWSAEQGIAIMRYEDGTASQESARLQLCSEYIELFFKQLFAKNSVSDIMEFYKGHVTASDSRDFSALTAALDNYAQGSIVIRIMQGSEDSGSFTIDAEKVILQISTFVKQAENKESTTQTGQTTGLNADSKNNPIGLYNAAFTAGVATAWSEYLAEEGYSIDGLHNYQEEGPFSQTKIVVTREGMGTDLLVYFPEALIEVGTNPNGEDIGVYIGTDYVTTP